MARLEVERETGSQLKCAYGAGWGTWIRTKTNRVRVCCATVTPFPNGIAEQIQLLIYLSDCGRKRVCANHGSGVAAFYLLGLGLASAAVHCL